MTTRQRSVEMINCKLSVYEHISFTRKIASVALVLSLFLTVSLLGFIYLLLEEYSKGIIDLELVSGLVSHFFWMILGLFFIFLFVVIFDCITLKRRKKE